MSEIEGPQEPIKRGAADKAQRRLSELEDHHEDFEPDPAAPMWLRPLLAYQGVMDRVAEAVGSVSKYLVILAVGVGFFNALLRYIGRFAGEQLTSNRYLELQWYLYSGVFLLAFAYILKNGINVRVDFWFANRSQRVKAAIDFVGHLIGLIPFTLLGIWAVWPSMGRTWGIRPDGTLPTWRVWEVWERSPDPQGLPRAPIKTLLLLGLLLLLLQALAEMVKLAAELTGHGRHTRRVSDMSGPVRVE